MAQYKALFIAGNSPVYQQDGGALSEDDTVTPPIALALGDTVDLLKLSGGTRLQHLSNFNGDFDTGATLQYSLGFRPADSGGALAANPSYFGSALTDLQSAVLGSAPTRRAFAPIDFNEDVIIFMTVTAAATGVSGTPSITTFATGKARGVK